MFNRIRIKNFKSFKDTSPITISPINLILGQNSSGKSSLIQTFLIIKQTLESPYSNEPIIINGSYCSIGDINDVINQSKQNKSDSFEFEFGLNYQNEKLGRQYGQQFWHSSNDVKFDSIDFHVHVGKAGEGQLSPIILDTSVTCRVGQNEISFASKLDTSLLEKLVTNYTIDPKILPLVKSSIYSVKINGLSEKIEAVLLSKFLPDIMIIQNEDKIPQLSKATLDSVVNLLVSKDPHAQRLGASFYNSKLIHLIRRFGSGGSASQKNIFDNSNHTFLDHIKSLLDSQKLIKEDINEELKRWNVILHQVEKDDLVTVEKMLVEGIEIIDKAKLENPELLAKRVWGLKMANDQKVEFDSCIAALKDAFKKLYYLGPLREEPKVFYNRLGANDPMYVGQRGENLAFVLKYYSKRRIPVIFPPEDVEMDWNPYKSDSLKNETLQDAVIAWLRYIGIAKNISVNEMGKIGLTINANIYGNKDSDLLNVGVGVSQVLPLIVLGLASPVNAILILEQPELHLHPFVQSRLGDFFTSLAATGKQIIAETHSEHLIHRMRYLVAKQYLKPQDDISIYYTQRNESIDSSEIINVKIDKYGSIDKWPEGFCDETEKQLSAILKASFERE